MVRIPFFGKKAPPAPVAKAAGVTSSSEFGWTPISLGGWTGSSYDRAFSRLVNEGFRNNIIIHRCLWLLGVNLLKFPPVIYNSKGEAYPDHIVTTLLESPSPRVNGFEYGMNLIYSLMLGGSAYVHKLRAGRKVVGLRVIQPDTFIQVIPSTGERLAAGYLVDYYEFMSTNGTVRVPADDIIHFKLPDPLNQYGGLSPLVAAYGSLRTDNEATEFKYYSFKNRGNNPGTILHTSTKLDDGKIERMKTAWKNAFSGANRGGVAVLEDIDKVTTLGMNFRDLEFAELTGVDEARLCMAFGVPAILAGAKIGLTTTADTNVEQENILFYENTIEPLLAMFQTVYNHNLVREFSPTDKLKYDTSDSPTAQKIGQIKRTDQMNQVNGGYITLNEWRLMQGLPEDPKGNYYLRPLGKIAVPLGGDPNDWLGSMGASDPTVTETKSACHCGKSHRRKKSFTPSEYARRLAVSGVRYSIAMGWLKSVRKWAGEELALEMKEIEAIVMGQQNKSADYNRKDSPTFSDQIDMFAELGAASKKWTSRIDSSSDAWMKSIIGQAGSAAIDEIGLEIAFNMESPETVAFVRGYSYRFAQRISNTTAEQVRAVFEGSVKDGKSYADIMAELRQINKEWTDSRVEMIARTESLRAANEGAIEGYKQGGIERIEWSAALGDACPDCEALDGTTISINEVFIEAGGTLPATGRVNGYEEIKGGGAHPNCRCVAIAVIEEL